MPPNKIVRLSVKLIGAWRVGVVVTTTPSISGVVLLDDAHTISSGAQDGPVIRAPGFEKRKMTNQ
jgi:hypothetical protein